MDKVVFSFCPSYKIPDVLRVRIGVVEGVQADFPLICTLQLFSSDTALSLHYRRFVIRTDGPLGFLEINDSDEWLKFPVRLRDLPLNSKLVIAIWETNKEGYDPLKCIGKASLPVFSSEGILKQGLQKVHLYLQSPSETAIKNEVSPNLRRLEQLDHFLIQYKSGEIHRISWLDKAVLEKLKLERSNALKSLDHPVIYMELPQIGVPIIYQERIYDEGIPQVSFDLGMCFENPAELKHRKLVRSQRNGPLDRDLKPNSKIRDELNMIMSYPPSQVLTIEEKDLIWKFRYYLTRDKRALTKFLKCVQWSDESEVHQAISLLSSWTEISIDDALELLGPSFKHPKVRAYAVSRLRTATNEELLLYLLQLVQALRYENTEKQSENDPDNSLSSFLVSRAANSKNICNYLYWYLLVEIEDSPKNLIFSEVMFAFQSNLSKTPAGLQTRDVLAKQASLIENLLKISKAIQAYRGTRKKKIEYLKELLRNDTYSLSRFEALPLPLDPSIEVCGIHPDGCSVFKSTMQPLRILFQCTDGSTYPIIFKNGDDLRQDQLVIQILILMDNLLKKEKLDLKLKPYRILATGPTHGAVQFVPSRTLASVLLEYHGSVLSFLREKNPSDRSEALYGIHPTAMDNYVRSCAGYCVITYLLGVGDRHFDNLLLTDDGHFFHADFGYILGRDPKLFSPAMKLSKEMVEGMGGYNSPFYQKFKSYCYTTFTALRKSANLILNLFSLMVDANIPDIKIDRDKVVFKVKERFCLEISESEAIKYFEQLINDSVSALFPQIIDRMHNLAQYMRS
ncbi:phosphatidylinositol 3-kinase Pik3 [Schizosaccharomyces japonicus yFS275]|uniref:Phosphatidylinositol 3-kinase VPS34 n=1 Tax=Schizosaccharomyces japonicus (strain yFS275 / FY16936) TaxID=402676 RepID=B6JXH5_SCHJY|nr:phosphatidylinositol 3-kinase Pik3 [Schizosaccharomyces japonicus yFS275]EEB05119.1 phosphatidylinositol 3-kinase Pik3 [Schizosaccharomyces japonicus yFS275]